jgi:hypothetical protein
MKKIYLLLVVVSLFISCQNDDENINTDTQWSVVNLSAGQNDWILSSDNSYFYCQFAMPEITSYIYTQGLVQIYYKVDGGQEALPYVRHFQDSEGALWTRTVDANFTSGLLTVYVSYSDFYMETPPAMNFRVVMMW